LLSICFPLFAAAIDKGGRKIKGHEAYVLKLKTFQEQKLHLQGVLKCNKLAAGLQGCKYLIEQPLP
jgi:hypothetical protein